MLLFFGEQYFLYLCRKIKAYLSLHQNVDMQYLNN